MIQYGLSLAIASIQRYQTQTAQTSTQAPAEPPATDAGAKSPQIKVGDDHAEHIESQRTAISNRRSESFAKELQAGAAGVQVSAQYSYSASGFGAQPPAFPTELTSGFLGALSAPDDTQQSVVSESYSYQFAQSVSGAGFGGFGGSGEFSFSLQAELNSSTSSSSFSFDFSYVFQGSVAQPPVASEPPPQVPDETTTPVPTPPPVVDSAPTPTPTPTPTPPPVEDTPVPVDEPTAPVLRKRVYSDTVNTNQRYERVSSRGGDRIEQLNKEDFARFRAVEKTKQLETSLQLELKTNDGDVISLDFSQIDTIIKNRFKGRTLDGERIRSRSVEEDLQRVVNLSVEGDISADEQAAIDKVLSAVIEVANAFFTGDTGAAVEKLQGLDFDGEQLAELSLGLSLSKSVSVSRGYQRNGDALQDLKVRDKSVAQALDFMASEQKRLVDVAKEVLDAPSAAKLVRSLVPVLASDPFAKISEEFGSLNDITQNLTELEALPEKEESEDS